MNEQATLNASPSFLGGGAAWKGVFALTVLSALMVTTGCSTRRVAQPAPVEDRSSGTVTDPKLLPGAENAGKPGYYTVRPGDTLFRIALDSGQNWRDVQAWNNMANPNAIEVGQVLRVAPPVTVMAGSMTPTVVPPSTGAATVSPITTTGVVSRPLTASSTTGTSSATTSPATAQTPATTPDPAGGDELEFIWPAKGQLVATFDEAKNKGVSIAGRLGDPVVAAASGRVVYAGAGLRGYGNLIILKHNNTYLTAYAHNQALLVREDQAVRQGQKIAEMGSSDADRVKLHFEVRRLGKPVDPMDYLPKQ
jgi:lipoprotein NlpD